MFKKLRLKREKAKARLLVDSVMRKFKDQPAQCEGALIALFFALGLSFEDFSSVVWEVAPSDIDLRCFPISMVADEKHVFEWAVRNHKSPETTRALILARASGIAPVIYHQRGIPQ